MGRIERMKRLIIEGANKRILKEGEGMDFWLEELSEFAIHLENGHYRPHNTLTHDDLTEFDIEEIKQILQNATKDKSLSNDEMTIVSEYGEDIIDNINKQSNMDTETFLDSLSNVEGGEDLDSGGYQNKIRHEYNIKLQFNTTVIDDETGEEWEGETIEELLDIPDSYEEGLKIFQQTKDKLERNKK